MLSSIRRTIIYYPAQTQQNFVAVLDFVILDPPSRKAIQSLMYFQGNIQFHKPHGGHFPNFEDEGGKERMVACTPRSLVW